MQMTYSGSKTYRDVKTIILNTSPFEDQILSINTLARNLQISPIPVREALFQLAARGIITFHQNRGFSVQQINHTDLMSAYNTIFAIILDAVDQQGDFELALMAKKARVLDGGHETSESGKSVADSYEHRIRTLSQLVCNQANQEVLGILFDRTERFRRSSLLHRSDVVESMDMLDRIETAMQGANPDGIRRHLKTYRAYRKERLLDEVVIIMNADAPQFVSVV